MKNGMFPCRGAYGVKIAGVYQMRKGLIDGPEALVETILVE